MKPRYKRERKRILSIKREFKALRRGSTKKSLFERHNESYKKYLESDEWKQIRDLFLSLNKYPKCQYCNTKKNLHVHHLSYNRLGTSGEIKDLTIFCKDHHFKIHKIAKKENVSIRVATKRLMALKPKKQIPPKKQGTAKELIKKENEQKVFVILQELRDKGIKTECRDLKILKKLKYKYIIKRYVI